MFYITLVAYPVLSFEAGKKKTIKAVIEYDSPIQAPITKGQKIGPLNAPHNRGFAL